MDAPAKTLSLDDGTPFLRVPPFPGSKPALLSPTPLSSTLDRDEADRILRRVVELRVGGTYWGVQPKLPDEPYILVHVRDPEVRREAMARVTPGLQTISSEGVDVPFDPWHLLKGATEAVVDAYDELALIAVLTGVPLRAVLAGLWTDVSSSDRAALKESMDRWLSQRFLSPFGGEALNFLDLVELSGFWRKLIDSNRELTAAVGFAFWKRETIAPLLWGGKDIRFLHATGSAKSGDRIAIWRSRTRTATLSQLEGSGAQIIEVEDGFIRSVGLGAECVPPLSIVVDHLGIYFDPNRPSELEQLLQQGIFAKEITDRAARLRELIVRLGISKYGAGDVPLERHREGRHLLVVGQVEDDRAVTAGLGPPTNLDLLRRVREANTHSYIIYKPHPDVVAGHRSGAIVDKDCLALADEIVRSGPISSLIQLVDEVHVNTSLAGFEALLRGKTVVTYGVPFYAGWGLTRDFGPVPTRRNATRSIDELVAAALLLYPRYLDPVTGLPCPPEILVRRIAEGKSSANPTPLVRLRRLQGRLKRVLVGVGLGPR